MPGNKTISIVIPVYNTEKFLVQCIESILTQKTLNDVEVILIDDGSTDGCPLICDKYAKKDNRVKVVHKKNGGLSEARNYGISAARGKYLMFVDSDDFLNSGCLDDIIKIIAQANFDVLIGYFNVVKDVDDGINWKENTLCAEHVNNKQSHTVIDYLTHNGIIVTAWRFIVRREFVSEHNLFFKPDISHEDLEWVPRIICAATSFWVYEKPFYVYRIRQNSISTSNNIKRIRDVLGIVESTNNLSKTVLGGERKKYLRMIMYWQFQHAYRSCLALGNDGKSIFRKWIKNNHRLAAGICQHNQKLFLLSKLFGIILALFLYRKLISLVNKRHEN